MKSRVIAAISLTACAVAVTLAVAVCALYPNKYAAELDAAADRVGLERSLVRAVVRTESGFDRTAVSHKGAMGLMQLMPETFAECAAELGASDSDPFDPEINLACGCYYLSQMLKKFDGDTTLALAAYNAGESNAKRFARGEKLYPETAAYIRKVLSARSVYRRLVG